jgi:phosphonate transport system permease protein
MPVRDASGLKIWQRRTGRESLFHWVLWLIGIAIFAYCWQKISASTTWFFVWDAPRIANDIWTRATPPQWEYITQLG